MTGADETRRQLDVEYFEYEAKHGGALGDRKTKEVIIGSTINSNIFRVMKFITEEHLRYGSRLVCLHFMHRKKNWNTFKKSFGRALNTKRSTCSVTVKAAFMSKLTRNYHL
jgi:hypothetical protein